MKLRMITFACHVCQTGLSVSDELSGQLVRCPVCRTAVKAPAGQAASTPAGAPGAHPPFAPRSIQPPGEELQRPLATNPAAPAAPQRRVVAPRYLPPSGPARRFGFPCCYCSSHLEATTDTSGNEGTCPTCGSSIIVPILSGSGQLIDPLTQQIIKPDPHPVHAYAAAGERAPLIIKDGNGNRVIRCPRCAATSAISANLCAKCGVPFTIEGAEGVAMPGSSNGLAVTSLVLGILSLPAFFLLLPAIGALGFGIIAIIRGNRSGTGGAGMAVTGIVMGALSLLLAAGRML